MKNCPPSWLTVPSADVQVPAARASNFAAVASVRWPHVVTRLLEIGAAWARQLEERRRPAMGSVTDQWLRELEVTLARRPE